MPLNPPPAWFAQQTTSQAARNTSKSLAAMVREATDNGRLLIQSLVDMVADPDTANRDRTAAISLLMDRGFGKAVETSLQLQVDAGSSDALAQLADHELERLASTLAPSAVRPVVVLPAASLSPDVDSLPDAPPEALEAPLRPRPTVTETDVSMARVPVDPLPAPLPRAPRRRIVVPRPVARPVATVDEPAVVDRSDVDGA